MSTYKFKSIKVLLFLLFLFILGSLSSIYTLKRNDYDDKYSNNESSLNPKPLTSSNSSIFDGLYVKYDFTPGGSSTQSSKFTYTHITGNIFSESWDVPGDTWQVNNNSRIMSSDSTFDDGSPPLEHTPIWIFTNVSITDTVLIAVADEGDNTFQIIDEGFKKITNYGYIDVWILKDLDQPGGYAYYDKNTGILLHGLFFHSGGALNYTFDIVSTNAEIKYYCTKNLFYDDFEKGLSKWSSITGLWDLTGAGSSWPDSYNSSSHSMWFGNESTGDYDTKFTERGNLTSIAIDLSSVNNAFLSFDHWRECEDETGFDVSYVFISNDSKNWNALYSIAAPYNVTPWKEEKFNISSYSGNSSVYIRFYFDTGDNEKNNFRGWLVDDVCIYTYTTCPPAIIPRGDGDDDDDEKEAEVIPGPNFMMLSIVTGIVIIALAYKLKNKIK